MGNAKSLKRHNPKNKDKKMPEGITILNAQNKVIGRFYDPADIKTPHNVFI